MSDYRSIDWLDAILQCDDLIEIMSCARACKVAVKDELEQLDNRIAALESTVRELNWQPWDEKQVPKDRPFLGLNPDGVHAQGIEYIRGQLCLYSDSDKPITGYPLPLPTHYMLIPAVKARELVPDVPDVEESK